VIEALIVAVGNERHPDGLFWVSTTRAIGGGYEGESRPFVVDFEPWYRETLEVETLAAGFGLQVAHQLGVGAMCKQKEDHRLLGEVAAWLAEHLGGIACAGGRLALPPTLLGRVVGLPVGSPTVHLLDAAAMRSWLTCPDFHMIK
jgi:hypothetical protein